MNQDSSQAQPEILVVDDKPDNVRLLSAILSQHGYDVRKALSSTRVVASVKEDAPDLILLDIKMPEMDGYQVCDILKRDLETREIPIIFISALDDALDKVRAFSVGGADYITKPFQEAEVLARIEHHLRIRALQRQLQVQNQELSRSNRELEQFAQLVSHDLQQPLQTIMGYAQILELQAADCLDQSSQECLDKIIEAGDRMQRLIRDVLSYALIGQANSKPVLIDGNVILGKALKNLEFMLKESQAHLSYPSFPHMFGNETQLVLLFQNLISNAVKFVRPGISPHVTITATQTDDAYCQFEVRDNGIGIPSDKFNQLFKSFHRLHSNSAYPGTGIGLATCKKIVENHGGQIWVESEPNVGTAFFFELPTQQLTQKA